VANIENEAWLIVRKAQAEAEQIKGLAQVRRCKRVCRVCKCVSVDLASHGTLPRAMSFVWLICGQNAATKRLEQARAEGLKYISQTFNWGANETKYLMSLDYVFKLIESSADPASKLETFLGLPADLRTVATRT
jgi:hypothetical protein